MVQKVVGYADKECKKIVFERDAREYDKSIGSTFFGLTLNDIAKIIPVIFVGGMLYANQQNVNAHLMDSIKEVSVSVEKDKDSISQLKTVLGNLDNYLSSKTGRQFEDGRPQPQ